MVVSKSDLSSIKSRIAATKAKKKDVAALIGVEKETFYLFLAGKRNLGRPALILLERVLREIEQKAS